MHGYAHKIGFGAITNSFYTVISVVSAIITVPLFIRAVGTEHYGLFVVVSSIVGFVGLSDFGVTAAVTNKISYFFAEQKKQEISELFSGALWFMVGILLIFILGMVGLFMSGLFSVEFIFGVESELAHLTLYLFIILFVFASVNILLGGLITSFFRGINEIPRFNVIQIVYIVLYSISFIFFLLSKPDIIAIALFQGVFLQIRLVMLFYFAKKKFVWLHFYFNIQLFKKVLPLLKHSVSFFFLSLCNSLISKTDFLVISHILGVAAAPIFSISDKIFRLPSQAIQVAGSAIPSIASLYTLKKKEQLADLYRQVLRMHIILRLSILFILLVYSKEIITLWVGDEFFENYYLVITFFVSYMVYSWVGPHFAFINSMFKEKSEIIPMILNVVINFVASIILAQKIGILGVVLGTVLGNVLTNAIYLPIFLKRHITIQPFYEIARIAVSFLMPALFVVLTYTAIAYAVEGYIYRLFGGIIVSIPYLVLVYFVTLQKNERVFILSKLSFYLKYFKQTV